MESGREEEKMKEEGREKGRKGGREEGRDGRREGENEGEKGEGWEKGEVGRKGRWRGRAEVNLVHMVPSSAIASDHACIKSCAE